MFSIDTADRVSIWNHAAVRLFGYDATDVVGREWAALFPEHRRHSLKVVFDAVAAGDRVDHYETEIERREAHGGTRGALRPRRVRRAARTSDRWPWSVTSPSSDWRRRCWPRPKHGCARARR